MAQSVDFQKPAKQPDNLPEPQVMASALKDNYNQAYIDKLGEEISRHHPAFDTVRFNMLIFDNQWEARALKERMKHISTCLHDLLNLPFQEILPILKKTAPDFSGFEAMFFPDYVERYGSEQWDLSLPALACFTQFSSSEFAVRPFILANQKKMMAQMEQWSKHDNEHIRRLASEGCRPRLPWAISLPPFKQNPSAILPVLESLKQDPSLYVRRSVANNLNDISKDNPQITLEVASTWWGQHEDTDWLIRHSLRTLLKQGNRQALQLTGFHQTDHIETTTFALDRHQLTIGESLTLNIEIRTKSKILGPIRLEYAIDYVKKTGRLSRKIFMLSESHCVHSNKTLRKNHAFKQLSTRKHYPGMHKITLLINGEEREQVCVMLLSA